MLQEISFIDQHHNFKHNFFPLAHVYTISIHMSKKQQMYINVIKRTMLIDKHYSSETNAEDKGVYNINRTQTIAVSDKKQVDYLFSIGVIYVSWSKLMQRTILTAQKLQCLFINRSNDPFSSDKQYLW